jgi:hypothetical protein
MGHPMKSLSHQNKVSAHRAGLSICGNLDAETLTFIIQTDGFAARY